CGGCARTAQKCLGDSPVSWPPVEFVLWCAVVCSGAGERCSRRSTPCWWKTRWPWPHRGWSHSICFGGPASRIAPSSFLGPRMKNQVAYSCMSRLFLSSRNHHFIETILYSASPAHLPELLNRGWRLCLKGVGRSIDVYRCPLGFSTVLLHCARAC